MKLVQFLFSALCLLLSSYSFSLEAVPGEYIIRYKNTNPGIQSFGKTSLQHNMNLKKSWSRLNLHHFKVRGSERDSVKTLKNLREDPDVLFAEPNYYVTASDLPYFMTSAPIRAPESWNQASSSGVGIVTPVVAVLDSGLDIEHPIFDETGRLWENIAEMDGVAGVDDDGNGQIDDFHGWNFINNNNNLSDSSGHGTHVAGIVIGATEDVAVLSGVENTKVMVLKFLDGDGVGTTSAAVSAIYYAVDNGAKILNNSWGGSEYSQALHEAITYSYYQGTLFVAAAGNNGSNNDVSPTFPANYDVPNVISVGASTDGDNRASFSNFGAETVDLLAPGVMIISSVPGGGYGASSGTSMSTPFVSGLAAMVVREAPQFSGYQIKEEILSSADSVSGANGVTLSGARVAFENTVGNAQLNKSSATFQPDYSPVYDYSSRDLASSDEAAGCGRVKEVYKNKFNHSGDKSISSLSVAEKFVFVLLFLIPLMSTLLARFFNKQRVKRKYKRVNVNLAGDLCFQGMNVAVDIKNFSAGGAGVVIKNKELLKHFINNSNDVTLKIYSKTDRYAYYPCKVVNNIKGKLGLKF